MRTKLFIVTLLIAAMSFSGCKKDKYLSEPPGFGELKISLNYLVDGLPLSFDTIKYVNAAGNNYSVTRLQYYISGMKFYKNGEVKYSIDSVFYVDAQSAITNNISIKNVPSYTYDYVTFYIGIENALNVHGLIKATAENTAMEWPDMMGGGYHFLKLEGHYKDSSQKIGYAMHLGNKDMQPSCSIYKSIYVPINTAARVNMTMNINEWFKNPYTYSFSKDGVYTMGNMDLMMKIRNNGNDVFYAE